MTDDLPQLPAGLSLARTTDIFDNDTVPPGLLRAHRIAEGVWGRLVVHSGSLDIVFEDADGAITLTEGDTQAIPPGRPHHVSMTGPASFAVAFYR